MNDDLTTDKLWNPARGAVTNGKDEMNLAEFPIASLRTRGDSRREIIYQGETVDRLTGLKMDQIWRVSGDSVLGLPNEFDERVYVALMATTARSGFSGRRVPFSIYQILKIMGQSTGARSYEFVERALRRLKGVTITAEGSFFDNSTKEYVRTTMSFNLIDKYWLRYREKDNHVREEVDVPAYIVWSEEIWRSFQAGYIKDLDLEYFYALANPTARRLYRLLDKRMWYDNRGDIDLKALAGRLGMVDYEHRSQIKRKLEPALQELLETGFLEKFYYDDQRGYTRVYFIRTPRQPRVTQTPAEEPGRGKGESVLDRLLALGISRDKANQLDERFDDDYIEEKLELLQWRMETHQRGRPITDPAAWLIRAIESDYQAPPGFLSPEARRQAQEEVDERRRHLEDMEREREKRWTEQQARQQEALAQFRQRYGTTEEDDTIWQKVCFSLSLTMAKPTFTAWVAPTRLLSLREGVATVGVPSAMAKGWIEDRLRVQITQTLEEFVGEKVEIQFVVVEPPVVD